MNYEQIVADLDHFSDSDSDSDLQINLPSYKLDEDEEKTKKKKKKNKHRTKKDVSSTKNVGAHSHKKVVSPRSKKGTNSVKKSSQKKNSKKKKSSIDKSPTNFKIQLRGKANKRFENIYEHYDDNGMSLSAFKECVKDLDLVDNLKISWNDVTLFFQEATGKKTIADFTMFLQALALLSIRRFPDGLDEDGSAALGRLLDTLEDEKDEQDYQAKRRAVLQAKQRAARRAKASKQKEQENEKKKETTEEQKKKSLEQQKKQEKIAQQRAYLRAKAKIRSEKEKERIKKEQEEKYVADAEEKKLVMAELRTQLMKQALHRTKQRLAEYEKIENEAIERQNTLLLKSMSTEPNDSDAVKLAAERVKFARTVRQEHERLEKEQKEKEAKIQKELEIQQGRMTAEKVQSLMEKTRKRLKAKLDAEKKHAEQEEKERKEKAERDSKLVKQAVATAEKRTSQKKIKIDLDEETENDLRRMFEPYAIKNKLYKVQWKDFVQKNKLCDGYNLQKADLDLLFSKSVQKGKKSLEFKQFCKAVASLGNKRFPVKKNTNPNDAIDRVLQATVRKNDPEEVKNRKAELRRKKKEHSLKKKSKEKRKKKEEELKEKQERELQEKQRKTREARIKEQMAKLEIAQKEHAIRMQKHRQKEERLRLKEEEKKKKEMEEILVTMEKRANELEMQTASATQRANDRVKVRAQYERENLERKAKIEMEMAAKNRKIAEEGRKKAAARVMQKKKTKMNLGKEETNNLQTLYDHYLSGSSFNRPDWINCTESLGLIDEAFVDKSDVEKAFVDVKNPGTSGINFQQFCCALGAIAQLTHPGEEKNQNDNSPSKCLERLLFEVMGGVDDIPAEFDPNLDDSYMDGYEETEEEKALRLAEEKAAKKARRKAKKKREREAKLKAEEEARIEAEKSRVAMEKIEEARKKAANRVLKRKKEKFTVNEDDKEKLAVFYDYFNISPAGLSRSDWLNCLSTLEIMDDTIIYKKDCEELFDEMCSKKTSGLNLEEFNIGMSLIAMQKFSDQQLSQSKALVQLIKILEDGNET